MMDTPRQEVARSFRAWRQSLARASERHEYDEVQRFLRLLASTGTPLIEGLAVHFIYYDQSTRSVALTGEVNDWGRTGITLPMTSLGRTGIFYRSIELNEPARLEYKLIVDGRMIADPLCPNTVDNGIGERNSYFAVGDFPEPPEVRRVDAIPHGRLEEFEFESRLLHNRRKIHIYLPPGYDNNPSRRFPTLYVNDGSEYLNRGRLPTVLDNLLASGRIHPLIAVMVDPVVRGLEYRASEQYAAFIESELIPYIDQRYRTIAQRETRGIMGASLGGLISAYVGLSRAHLFSKIGGQSSAFHLEEAKIANLLSGLKSRTEFCFDLGKYEPRYTAAHRRIIGWLNASGRRCFFQELPGGHNWTSWRTHLPDLLINLWHVEHSRS